MTLGMMDVTCADGAGVVFYDSSNMYVWPMFFRKATEAETFRVWVESEKQTDFRMVERDTLAFMFSEWSLNGGKAPVRLIDSGTGGVIFPGERYFKLRVRIDGKWEEHCYTDYYTMVNIVRKLAQIPETFLSPKPRLVKISWETAR